MSFAGRGEMAMKSCLVVDDSSVIRKVARRILEDLDFEVSEAEDGQQALEFCRQFMPDLILVDWTCRWLAASSSWHPCAANLPARSRRSSSALARTTSPPSLVPCGPAPTTTSSSRSSPDVSPRG